MTTKISTTIRQSELIDRQVVYKSNNLGKVTKILFDPIAHRVEGLICLSNTVPLQKWLLSWSAIDCLDSDRISVSSGDRKLKPSHLIQLKSLRGQELWSDNRNRVGRLIDYHFDRQSGTIIDYLFVYGNGA